jgi:4-amino-4-deoxy-L-arabinose transferase-like glycosyltransferase
MDMGLAASFAVGMLAWWAWRESGKRMYLAAFYLCMTLGALAKGPVAPFLAALIIVIYAAATRELDFVVKTLWLPGILLFCALALPWYVAVEIRNPQFFHEFILQHNLARFSTNLYHHPEPFWYYIPVAALALVPWVVFVLAAFLESALVWWAERKAEERDLHLHFRVFACCWFVVPVLFFSLSQSKLPGYILPAVPAGAVLLADYLRQRLEEQIPASKWLVVLHGIVACAPIVPAVLVTSIVTEHRPAMGRPLFFALAVALVLCVALILTLLSRAHLRMLRFITLIPVVLSVAAVLKLGTIAIDQKISTRPLAVELANLETHRLPLAVCGASREVEFGLAFYRDQVVSRYEAGNVPRAEHLLVALPSWKPNVDDLTRGRRVSFLGHYAPQNVDYYWVSAVAAVEKH